jgi:hypothetical protein
VFPLFCGDHGVFLKNLHEAISSRNRTGGYFPEVGKASAMGSGTNEVVMLDVDRRICQGIHQDQKVVRAVMFLLMMKQKIHEGLFELHPVPPFSMGVVRCVSPGGAHATVMSLAR